MVSLSIRKFVHTLFGCSIDSAWQFWMWLCCFGSDHDVGPIFGCFQGDSFPDSSAGTSNENRATG